MTCHVQGKYNNKTLTQGYKFIPYHSKERYIIDIMSNIRRGHNSYLSSHPSRMPEVAILTIGRVNLGEKGHRTY